MALKLAPQVPSAEKIQASYKQLAAAAVTLNAASDGLGEAISLFDASLKRLNLGVSAWVTISEGGEEQDQEWWSRDIGYTRVSNRWGIALKDASGNYNWPERDSIETWLFNDAPRWMRIEAVAKIPELLDALCRQTEDATKKIKSKTEEALAFAAALRVAEEISPMGRK